MRCLRGSGEPPPRAAGTAFLLRRYHSRYSWPAERPTLHGTGTEDYFLTAWGPRQKFCGPYAGLTMPGGINYCGRLSMYRFHIEDPVMFNEHLRFSIEHGHANRRSDDWSSVAYFYLEHPGTANMPRIAVEDRIPYPADHAPGLVCVEK